MFLKEIPMIYLDKKDLQKSRKDPNPREEIIGLKCLSHFPNFIKVDQWPLALEEGRSAEDARDRAMKVEFYIHAKLVAGVVKWKGLCKSKEKPNKCK